MFPSTDQKLHSKIFPLKGFVHRCDGRVDGNDAGIYHRGDGRNCVRDLDVSKWRTERGFGKVKPIDERMELTFAKIISARFGGPLGFPLTQLLNDQRVH